MTQELQGIDTDGQGFGQSTLLQADSFRQFEAVAGRHHDILGQAARFLTRAAQKEQVEAGVRAPRPALYALSAGDSRIHGYRVTRFQVACLFPRFLHNRAAFVSHNKGVSYDLISNASLLIVVKIRTAHSDLADSQQDLVVILKVRCRRFPDLQFSDPCQKGRFHFMPAVIRCYFYNIFPCIHKHK